MRKTKAFYRNLSGTNYQIGQNLADWMKSRPGMLDKLLFAPGTYPQQKLEAAAKLLNKYCPGVNEEIKGFADRLGIHPGQVLHYAMSYLERGCSLMAALPEKTADGRTLLACTYDFNDEIEDLCLTCTRVEGKYAHISTLGNTFGRTNGMNEHGLAVCMSSNGIPVGDYEGGAKAAVTGLTFWSVVRSLLESCRNVGEALERLKEIPIGFNLNLMMADAGGTIALFQCLNGYKAHKLLVPGDAEAHLCVTNHTVLPQLMELERVQLENSVQRRSLIQQAFHVPGKISRADIRNLIATGFPHGLCCHYYQGFFGLLHAVIFDVEHRSLELVFGSPQSNVWRTFGMDSPCEDRAFEVVLPYEAAPASFYNTINRNSNKSNQQ